MADVPPAELRTVAQAARAVLLAAEPKAKIRAARAAARAWRSGRLEHRFDVAMPDRPARPVRPELLPPGRMPKRGKGGSERGRIAWLHALAHIEFGAIDLAFDLAGRFGADFPPDFVTDWFGVGADEACISPCSTGAWRLSAPSTAPCRRMKDCGKRRRRPPATCSRGWPWCRWCWRRGGLDVTPATVARFEAAGDDRSAKILDRVYRDEIRHVAAGTSWFTRAAESRGFAPVNHWHALVEHHCRAAIKPPFNDSARDQAGLSRDFYLGLAPASRL